MKPTFLKYEKPIITAMVQADNPGRVKQLMKACADDGAEAFGMQFCRMKKEFRTPEIYRDLFDAAGERPVYVTNYRLGENESKPDDVIADEILELASCGATLCDMMGDLFDRQTDEMARNAYAIERQMRLIEKIHDVGGEVLMSSHVLRYTPAERVLEIALEQQKRGADICKIVTGAESMEQQIENLRIIDLLKKNLRIPFLFLNGGECRMVRRLGGHLGCCMYLCVHEYDDLATPSQPLVRDIKLIRDTLEM